MDLNRLKYGWVFFWSFLALLGERLWNSFWAALCVLALFAACALLNLLFIFGDKGHIFLLAAFAAAFVLACWRIGSRFVFPGRADVERHIERASGIEHRPLEALRDRPAPNLSSAAQDLWRMHVTRMRGYLSKLRIHRPRSDVPRQDRYALRHAALLMLAAGIFVAGSAAPSRLQQALAPNIAAIYRPAPVALDAWITPPEYTQAAPVFLASTQTGAALHQGDVEVPGDSILKVRLSGYARPPRVYYDDERIAVTKVSDKSYTLEMPLQKSGKLRIRQNFRKLGEWNVAILPDSAPAVELLMTDKTPRAALKITYKVDDDYGVAKITGTIEPPPELAEKAKDIPLSFNIPVSTSEKEHKIHVEDLSSSILAGMPVTLTLTAEDNVGHKANSIPKKIYLPERQFNNPAAQRLIVERKRLLWFESFFATLFAAETMADVANHPAWYKGDMVVFMALAQGVKRLGYDGDAESVASVRDLLWDVALKIEDGGLSMAARDLREALQKLSEALNDKNATDEELQQLAQDVQREMMNYMQTLANEMQQRAAEGKKTPQIPPELAQKFMQHMDMEKLMQQLKEMQQGSGREQMQKMAEFYKNALDNMDMQKMQEMQESQQRAMEALQDMQKMIERQQQLIDKTGKKQQGEGTQEEAKEQQGIRDELGETMRQLGEGMPEIPENFGRADQEMKNAHKQLSDGKAKDSIPAQKAALKELQDGLDKSIEQMAQGMQQMILSFGAMPKNNNYGEGYDPLGREDGSGMPKDSDVVIPEEAERRRVQEIIRELRDRSNDYQRPKAEREYIDRLLDMFY